MAGAEKGIAKHVDDSAGALETRLRAMIPPQAAVVTFTLTVALEYVDAILRLIAQAVANSPEIPDKDATIRAGILAKLAEAHIDVKFKRVSETRYDLTALRVAGATGPELHTQIGEDTWLLSELGG
jgi:hypothetical protein